MTQEELDNIVLSIASRGIDYAEITCDFRRQSDPDSLRRETGYIMLRNIIYSLQNYDITSGVLEDSEIDYLIELAELILEVYPNQLATGNEWTNVPDPQEYDAIELIMADSVSFQMTLTGTGDTPINWGDGDTEIIEIEETGTVITHEILGSSTITIGNKTGITGIQSSSGNISSVNISAECVNIKEIVFDKTLDETEPITQFVSRPEWILLEVLQIYGTPTYSFEPGDPYLIGLSELTTYASWVNLKELYLQYQPFTELITHKEWVNIELINLQYTFTESIDTHEEWINLRDLLIYSKISQLTTYESWINLEQIQLAWYPRNPLNGGVDETSPIDSLSELITYASWTKLRYISIVQFPTITSFILREEWVALERFGITNAPLLLSINTYAIWSEIKSFSVTKTGVTVFNTYDTWTKVEQIFMQGSPITNFVLHTTWTLLHYIYFYYTNYGTPIEILSTNLNESAVNQLLINADALGWATNYYHIEMSDYYGTLGNNAEPTGLGLVAYNNLKARHVRMYIKGYGFSS